jgi:hypothetical protein
VQEKSFGYDNPARGIDIIQTNDKGFLITGNTFSVTTRRASAVLIKTDRKGKLDWKKEYSNELKSYFGWSIVESNDGYMVLGFSENKESTKGLMIKTDFQGNILWEKEIGTYQKQVAWSFLKNNNELVCVGEINEPAGINKVWLFKTDLNGNILWEKTIQSEDRSERVFYIDQLDQNNFVATGTSTLGTKDEDDILALKFDDSGKILWKESIPIKQGRDVGHALKVYDNNIYVYGYHEVAKDHFNPVIVKLDANGNTVQNITITHEKDIRIMNGIKHNNGHILVGYSKKIDDRFFQLSIIKVDNDGIVKDMDSFGVEGLNTGYSIKNIGASEFVITGAITKDDKTKKSEIEFIKGKLK